MLASDALPELESAADNTDWTLMDAELDLLQKLGLDPDSLAESDVAAIRAMAREILSLRTQKTALQDELQSVERLADNDPLCPVFNRRAFERELVREVANCERYGSSLSVIYIDLDRFKQINDSLGHSAGDTVLIAVAKTLRANIRQTDTIGRVGGDEFAILLPHADLADAEQKANALQNLVEDMTLPGLDHASLKIGVTCGCASWSKQIGARQLFDSADEAMYRRKRPSGAA